MIASEKKLPEVKNPSSLSADEVISLLETSRDNGLSDREAKERLAGYGPNKLLEEKGPSAMRILMEQFSNVLIIILLIATLLSALLGELIDSLVIIVIVALVAALGFSQEFRTARLLTALKEMQSLKVDVVREAEVSEIDVEELVPGDIVIVEAGDKISADMRLVESYNLRVNESALTGESVPVSKMVNQLPSGALVADQVNMLFSGTSVTDGKGLAVTVSTGMKTELGLIAGQVSKPTKKIATNLERRMDEIGKKIGLIVLALVIGIVALSIWEQYFLTGAVTFESLVTITLFGVALAVAAIPEALPAIIVGSLAYGAHRMARDSALTRNLSAVETLGVTHVICSDKTGTLTKGEMTVKAVFAAGNSYSVSGAGYDPVGEVTSADARVHAEEILNELARAATLCNDATLVKDERERWTIRGDPTEGALVVLAEKMGLSQQNVRSNLPRIWEIPFSSETKRMTTVHRKNPGEIAYMKGAPESVLERCSSLLQEEGPVAMDSFLRERILGEAESMASRALRVLAVARREISNNDEHNADTLEREFEFIGLVGMIDPPRPEAIESIKTAKRIGMRTIMITGDHKVTALSIATEMGIFSEGDVALTGEELQSKSDQEYEQIADRATVYARVSPFDKLRIIEAWQKKNKIVAMTGDGVNDALALKRADIGIAMGITGTEVAKESSDMILLDDNFTTIMKAVAIGRWIQDNVKKYLSYLLAANFVEITVISVGVLLASLFLSSSSGEPLIPLLAVQVLYINLATDGLPALAVGIGPPDPDVMQRKVQEKKELTVFSPEVRKFIIWIVIGQTPLLLLVYLSAMGAGIDEARTRLFLTFVFSELIIALTARSLRFPINRVKPHKWLSLSIVFEVVLLVVLMEVPEVRNALSILSPTFADFGWAITASAITLIYIESLKRIFYHRGKKDMK